MICIHIQNCDWPVLFLTFAMNTTQVGFESLFPWQLSATNCAFVVWSILVNCFYIKWTHSIIAFNEGERILIMSFNGNHSWGFYVPRGSIVMPCDFRHWAPFWTGWLAGWLCSTNSLYLICKCFLGCLQLKTPISFLCNQYNKKIFTRDRMQRSQNKVVHFSWDCNQPILFASQWQFPKDPRNHAHDWKQRRLHLVLIFECTFQWLITCASGYFFSQLFFLIKHF